MKYLPLLLALGLIAAVGLAIGLAFTSRQPVRVLPASGELAIPLTSFRVQRVRLVLDTKRKPGWHEFDAVEIVGPDGRAWAKHARAGSTWNQ